MNPPNDGERDDAHSDEGHQPHSALSERITRGKNDARHLDDNAYLKQSIESFNGPVGNRVGAMGCLTIDEEECDRADDGEDTPRGKHRKGAKSASQADNTEK